MERFQFASSLTEDEYQNAQRLAAKERSGVYFLVYVWPKLGYALGAIVIFAALMLQAGKGYGGLVGMPVGGALVGSALWLHYGTQHRIGAQFRSAGLWHRMSVTADAGGISIDCETGTKAYLPWHAFSRVLANDSVLVLLQTQDRFGVVSLTELDQQQRGDLLSFVIARVGKPQVES